jgi:hypothetical protein
MSHVFISHSHNDAGAADLILRALEKRGVKCWIAPRDVTAGGSYAESILNAIETASCFVLIYSNNSNLSPHVVREVERALKFGVNIIPVRFDQSAPSKSLDYLLATVHWLSISEPVAGEIAKAAEQIAAAVARAQPRPSGLSQGSVAVSGPVAATGQSRKAIFAVAGILLAILIIGGVAALRPSHRAQPVPPLPQAQSSPSQAPFPSSTVITGPIVIESKQARTAAPAPEGEPVDEITQQNITDFVKGFAQDLSGNNIARRIAHFSSPCRYYSNSTASPDDIRQDAQEEIAQWRERTNMPGRVNAEKLNDSEFRVRFSMIYSYRGKSPSASGIRNFIMIVKPKGTTYAISAISKSDLR